MSLKYTVANTCLWCIVVALAAMTLLMTTWTLILVGG